MIGKKRSPTRSLAWTAPEDSKVTGGRPLLFAFGLGYLARISARARRTVREAMSGSDSGHGLPLHDPVEAVAWAIARRGKPRLGDEVLEALGYEPRYAVEKNM